MTLFEQIKNIFYELFKVSGFDDKQKNEMVEEILNIWLTKSFVKIHGLMTDDEKKKLTILLNNFKKNTKNEQSQKELFQLMSKLDKDRNEKAIDIFYEEAGIISERMINKFNLKSTPQQKEVFAKKISPFLIGTLK